MPLSSTDRRASSSFDASSSSASRTSTSRRCHGVHVRQVSNAALRGLHGLVDVVGAGERHRALDLAGGRVHVLVHASAAAAAPLVTDVQVHVGHGAIERSHGSPLCPIVVKPMHQLG